MQVVSAAYSGTSIYDIPDAPRTGNSDFVANIFRDIFL